MKRLLLVLFLIWARILSAQQPTTTVFGSGPPGGQVAYIPGTHYIDQSQNPAVLYVCTSVSVATGPTPPAGTQTCNWTIAGSGATGVQNTISPLSAPYNGKFDVKFIYDAGWTNATSTVTCPNTDCGFTAADVGKIEFGTSDTNIASSIGTGVTMPQGTILTIGGASSITVSGTASATCTAGGGVLCDFAWGSQDDTTAINNAMTAAWGTAGVCKALELPSGNAFFSAQILNMSITQLSQACGGSQGSAVVSGVDTNQQGPTVFGQGPGNSVLIPLPSFTLPCAGSICIGGTGNMYAHDFGVNGLGQTLNGRADTGMQFMLLQGSSGGGSCTGSTGFNIGLSGWGVQDTGTIGLQMGTNACGDPVYFNIVSERFGATNCKLNTPFVMAVYGLACFGSTSSVLSIACTTGTVDTYGSSFFDIDVAGNTVSQDGCTWNSFGDIFNTTTASATLFSYGVASHATTTNLTGDSISSAGSSFVFGGGASATVNVHIKNTTFLTTATFSNANSNVNFFDDGGNAFSVPTSNSTIPGQWVADGHSVKGACTGVATAASTLGLYGTGPNVTTTTCTTTTIGSGVVVQGSRTLQNLIVKTTAAGVNASSGVVTVLKNGGATTITCTVGTGTACTDTTHSVAVVDGDLISIQFTTQGADTLAGVKAIVGWN